MNIKSIHHQSHSFCPSIEYRWANQRWIGWCQWYDRRYWSSMCKMSRIFAWDDEIEKFHFRSVSVTSVWQDIPMTPELLQVKWELATNRKQKEDDYLEMCFSHSLVLSFVLLNKVNLDVNCKKKMRMKWTITIVLFKDVPFDLILNQRRNNRSSGIDDLSWALLFFSLIYTTWMKIWNGQIEEERNTHAHTKNCYERKSNEEKRENIIETS